MEPNRSGNAGQYSKVLKAASEYGLSLETRGRLGLRATPRSTINWDTGLERMDDPRSAWMVSWSRSTPWVRTASWMKSVASSADSVWATQFRDVPRPNLVRLRGHELGLLLGRVGPLTPTFLRFPVAPEQAVHGGLRAQVGAIVQGATPHLSHGQIAVVRPMQQLQHGCAFGGAEGVGWGRPGTRRSTPRCPTSSVVGGPGSTEQLTSPPSPDSFSQFWVVVVDHLNYFSWVSALLEMPSKSA